jgi:transposase
LTREREALVIERTRHVNRIKGLLATQGVFGFEPMRKSHRRQMEQLRGWDGQTLPPRLKAELARELNRLELVISQVAAVEDERDRALKAQQHPAPSISAPEAATGAQPVATEHAGRLLLRLRSIGPSLHPCSPRRRSTGISVTGGKLQDTPAWCPAPGRVAE